MSDKDCCNCCDNKECKPCPGCDCCCSCCQDYEDGKKCICSPPKESRDTKVKK